MTAPFLRRLALITGDAGIVALSQTHVLIVGLGGVGSWCAEALVRGGIGALTLLDSDAVCVTNINRQVQATARTVGRLKTEALRERLLDIHGGVDIALISDVFSAQNAAACRAPFERGGYVIDAIDSLGPKLDLVEHAARAGMTLFSSMGMAQKLDPTLIRAADIWDTRGCPLARLVRQGLRKRGFAGHFTAVYSPERLPLKEAASTGCGGPCCLCPKRSGGAEERPDWCSSKKVINGSAAPVTASAGMVLASLVMRDVLAKSGGGRRYCVLTLSRAM